MAKLSINLVTWNGAHYITQLLLSLKNQTFKDWELIVIDNASKDVTSQVVPWIAKLYDLPCTFVQNIENVGFAKGHNQALAINKTEYVLVLNQDIYLMPDCLEKMIKTMDTNHHVGSLAPRLMRWDFPKPERPEPDTVKPLDIETTFTSTIDSLGLRVLRNRRVLEVRAGETWNDNTVERNNEVFGVSGACALYRRAAIESVLCQGTFFDETFGSYKEDVDCAFRLHSAGWKSLVLYDAVVYHDRTAFEPDNKNDFGAARNKKTQSPATRINSYKNHLAMLYKNEYWQNFLLDFPWILWYEIKKFCWFLLFDRAVLKGLGEVWKSRKDLKIKRLKIKNIRKAPWKEMRKWWN